MTPDEAVLKRLSQLVSPDELTRARRAVADEEWVPTMQTLLLEATRREREALGLTEAELSGSTFRGLDRWGGYAGRSFKQWAQRNKPSLAHWHGGYLRDQ